MSGRWLALGFMNDQPYGGIMVVSLSLNKAGDFLGGVSICRRWRESIPRGGFPWRKCLEIPMMLWWNYGGHGPEIPLNHGPMVVNRSFSYWDPEWEYYFRRISKCLISKNSFSSISSNIISYFVWAFDPSSVCKCSTCACAQTRRSPYVRIAVTWVLRRHGLEYGVTNFLGCCTVEVTGRGRFWNSSEHYVAYFEPRFRQFDAVFDHHAPQNSICARPLWCFRNPANTSWGW